MSAQDTQLAAIYREACALDVQAFKPGNVSLASPGHAMSADDFLLSAQHSAPAMVQRGCALGLRIFDAVAATRRQICCNTNLGIVLLAAPLLQAGLEYPDMELRSALRRVLAATTREDAVWLYRAIRLAAPGGLGKRAAHDIADEPRLTLVAAMAEAAGHDLIARQYANGFAELFDDIQPAFSAALARRGSAEKALTETFLYLLAGYPDTHIRRKHGAAAARRVSRMAHTAAGDFARAVDADAEARVLAALDATLKSQGLNPGTSADLCVAAVISHRLQQLAVSNTGANPENLRTAGPERAGAPLSSISQVSEGEIQWQ
jgi:triphosphoribosyl-dephospho-CoA synthase